jgi:hypothetical protein
MTRKNPREITLGNLLKTGNMLRVKYDPEPPQEIGTVTDPLQDKIVGQMAITPLTPETISHLVETTPLLEVTLQREVTLVTKAISHVVTQATVMVTIITHPVVILATEVTLVTKAICQLATKATEMVTTVTPLEATLVTEMAIKAKITLALEVIILTILVPGVTLVTETIMVTKVAQVVTLIPAHPTGPCLKIGEVEALRGVHLMILGDTLPIGET